MYFLKQFEWIDWTLLAVWIIIFIITIIVELETFNLVSIWFSLGSLVALICGIIFASPLAQIFIFLGTSAVAVAATRPFVKKLTGRSIIRTNADRFVGKVGVVTKEIRPFEIGEVKVNNSFWRAINKDNETINVGALVSVDGIEGIKLIVSKIDNKSNMEIL
ncbi:MAG: NfeD family protein [Bacillota bacterium]|jgi:membrane protein implicated in regulation of membrane protease activity|nr:NfeD family protein [Bacillota bacterium]